MMKDDNTEEIYLTTYDKETKMNMVLHFNQDSSNDGNFARAVLQSVADTYDIIIYDEGNIIKPTAN